MEDEIKEDLWAEDLKYELLVSVSGNSLELNQDAVRRVTKRFRGDDDAPVVVLSAVGQPKSGKTSLLNSLIAHICGAYGREGFTFPGNRDEVSAGAQSDLNGLEGILMWTSQGEIPEKDGTLLRWIFLDVWMENPRMEVYNKLVDVCFAISSTVVFSEPCDPNPEVYWQPHTSLLSSVSRYCCTSLQLHFFILTEEGSEVLYSFVEGGPSENQCKQGFLSKLSVVRDTVSFLEHRCNRVTSAVMPFTKSYLKGAQMNRVQLKAFDRILTYHLRSPFPIKSELVTMSRIPAWLGNVISAFSCLSNSSSCGLTETEFKDSDIAPVTPDEKAAAVPDEQHYQAITFSKVPSEIRPYEGMDEYISKIVATYGKEFQTVFENENTFRGMNDEDLRMYHEKISTKIFDDVNVSPACLDLNTKIHEALYGLFEKIKKQNIEKQLRVNSFVVEAKTRVEKLMTEIETKLCYQLPRSTPPYHFSLEEEDERQFRRLHEDLLSEVPVHWGKLISDIITPMRDHLVGQFIGIGLMKRAYQRRFNTQLKQAVCFDPSHFDPLHRKCYRHAKNSSGYKISYRDKLNNLCAEAVRHFEAYFFRKNQQMLTKEKYIADRAHAYAVQKYRGFMDDKIASSTLNEVQLQRLHHFVSSKITSLFLEHMDPPHRHCQPWLDEDIRLRQTLETLLISYKHKNQDHLRRISAERMEGFKDGKYIYEDVMGKMADAQLSPQLIDDCHNNAVNKAVLKLKEKTSNIHIQITQSWVEELETELGTLKQNYITDVLPVGIGLYIDPHEVRVRTYRSQEDKISESITSYEPFVAFAGGTVLVGKEAQEAFPENCHRLIQVFKLLRQVEKEEFWDITSDGKSASLGGDEILAIFFQKIRLSTEKSLKLRVRSCHVVVTALLPSASKQMLKTALKNAGFEKNTLIPCTTAMAISYVLNYRETDFAKRSNEHAVVSVYVSSDVVEIASLKVTPEVVDPLVVVGDTTILVSRTNSGGLNLSTRRDAKLNRRVSQLMWLASSGLKSSYQYDRVISYRSYSISGNLEEAISKQISRIPSSNPAGDIDIHEILGVAAYLDAKRNQHPDFLQNRIQIPKYRNISPFKIKLTVGETHRDILQFSHPTGVSMMHEMQQDHNSFTNVTVQEYARDPGREWTVAEYKFRSSVRSPGSNDKLLIFLNEDGNLTVEAPPGSVQAVKKCLRSLTLEGRLQISEVLKPLLAAEEVVQQDFAVVDDPAANPVCELVAMKEKANENEEIFRDVKFLIDQVKFQLENSKSTATSMRDHIYSKINKCEDLMLASEVKVRQLQMERTNLERAARLLKP